MYAIRSYYDGLLSLANKSSGGDLLERITGLRKSVITSYSIHYTKLYEMGGLSYEGGIAGSCASFDGITAKIQVPHSGDLNLDGPFTLSCWIKSDKTRRNGESIPSSLVRTIVKGLVVVFKMFGKNNQQLSAHIVCRL